MSLNLLFLNFKVKIEVKEEEVSLEEESDEHGHMSASSIDSGNRNDQEAKNTPIELGMRRYSYDVFMKRVQGMETLLKSTFLFPSHRIFNFF